MSPMKDWSLLTQAEWQERGKKQAEARRKGQRSYHTRLRQKVLEVLGGKCVRCGFSDPRALQADHKAGGGNEHRRQVDYSTRMRQILKYPDEFQLLCSNCNWIKRSENGEVGTFKGELPQYLLTNPRDPKDQNELLSLQGIKPMNTID